MPHGAERGDRRGADALRRRVGREQFRMRALDAAQLEHEPVVFGVRHFRIVERVIAIVVSIQELAQLAAARRRLLRLDPPLSSRSRSAVAQPSNEA